MKRRGILIKKNDFSNKNKDLAVKIKFNIISKNLSQQEIAKKMNVSPAMVSKTLSNLKKGEGISTTTLFKFCNSLNIDIKNLF
ncbi:helix-turn-helix domain-containing protein [Cetobacterium ceti]|uniref:helix-turn-helix domain-containing protein n=1 Tax=Cetobacterium ceti TaxID=180163 RepID=UPI00389909B7